MKLNSSLSTAVVLALLLIMTESFTARAQAPVTRPTPPTPSRITRPTAPVAPGGRASGAVTQPSNGGTMPNIPYDDSPNALNFQDTSAHLVIMEYALRTGRTVLMAPGISPDIKITLRTTMDSPLDDKQYLMAIEQVLNFNGIALEPVGDKFLNVVLSADLRKYGPKTIFADPETGEMPLNEEKGQLVSQMIEFKYITLTEATGIISAFARKDAQIQPITQNSVLITDSADTVNRIVEVVKHIDKPILAREKTRFVQINYAKAGDVKTRIKEIFDSAKEQDGKTTAMAQERSSGAPGTELKKLPAGVMFSSNRDRAADNAGKSPETFESIIAEAQRSILRSEVSMIADERTNLLIIITNPEAMVFIEEVIKYLDVPTAPEIVVEVNRLEHAVAKDVAAILNDLIGSKKAAEGDAKPSARRDGDAPDQTPAVKAPSSTFNTGKAAVSGDARTKVGQLDSESIKILADERTNAILIMANYGDMVVIRDIIKQMDIMLSQVAIEVVILSLNFKDGFETGMNWVQRAMLAGQNQDGTGPALAFASAGGGGGETLAPKNTLDLTATDTLTSYGAGATFLTTIFDFNIDLIIKAVETDSRARLMTSPIITTLDNKEAILESTERIYYTEGTTQYNNSENTTQNIKNEDIGVKLKVTPRINKKGYILLTIEQEWQDLGSGQVIDGETLPTVNTRKMGSDVAVQSGETVVLGGLASNSETTSNSRVPLLGDIPILGWLFRSTSISKSRNEIIIFITPRGLDTRGQIEDESRNRKANLDTEGIWNSGWSNSRLADPISEKTEEDHIERGRQTIAPPRYPLTRHLTTLNPEYGITPEIAPTNRLGSRFEYSHFSDIDEDKEVVEPDDTGVKSAPAETNGAFSVESSPMEPAEAPVKDVISTPSKAVPTPAIATSPAPISAPAKQPVAPAKATTPVKTAPVISMSPATTNASAESLVVPVNVIEPVTPASNATPEAVTSEAATSIDEAIKAILP